MAVEGINISLAEVSATASTVRTINQQLSARLEDIKQEMNGLASSWQSEGSETIRAKFNGLAPQFENYREIIESYAQFLDNTVAGYEAAENAVNSNASAFK